MTARFPVCPHCANVGNVGLTVLWDAPYRDCSVCGVAGHPCELVDAPTVRAIHLAVCAVLTCALNVAATGGKP